MNRYLWLITLSIITTTTLMANTNSIPSNISGIISQFVGATSGVAGTPGSVPSPAAGQNNNFLRGDATWQNIIAPVFGYVSLTASGCNGTQQTITFTTNNTWNALQVVGTRLVFSAGTTSGGVTIGTNVVNIATTGTYRIQVANQVVMSTAGQAYNQIIQNSTTVLSSNGAAAPDSASFTNEWIGTLNAGDTIDVRYGGNAGTSLTVQAVQLSVTQIK